MTQPSPREQIENLWDRATPIGPLLDAYRDDIAINMGRDLLRDGLKPFLLRLIGEQNTDMILESVRAAVLRNDAYRAAVLREAADWLHSIGEREAAHQLRGMADGSQP